MDTLVLSFTYTPVARIPSFRALKMVLSGRAEVLEEYSDQTINSFSASWFVPSVIRFVRKAVNFFHRRYIRFNRKNIWLRDKGTCQYCGNAVSIREFTFDHVTPLSQGGKTTWDNIVVSCRACNQKKTNRTPKQARMALLTQPVCPKSLPATSLNDLWGTDVPETWKEYLGSVQYWQGILDQNG